MANVGCETCGAPVELIDGGKGGYQYVHGAMNLSVAQLEEEVERLRGEVHECPACGESCKQCQCAEKQIAALETENKRLKSECLTYPKLVCELEAEIARLRAATAWQPISTAPKDGTSIVVYSPDPNAVDPVDCIDVANWNVCGWDGSNGFVATDPTHWKPLPESPANQFANATIHGIDHGGETVYRDGQVVSDTIHVAPIPLKYETYPDGTLRHPELTPVMPPVEMPADLEPTISLSADEIARRNAERPPQGGE